MARRPIKNTTHKREHPFLSRVQKASKPSHYHTLIFGPSRAGKTTFIGTAGVYEPTSPLLLLDFEGGANSIIGKPGVDVARMRDWQDFNQAYDYLDGSDHSYKAVAVDSISELHVFSVLDLVEKGAAENDRRSPDTAELQDYGKAMIMLRRFIRAMNKLPMHVFISALTKTDTVPREGKVQVPFMFGQMAGEVVGSYPVVTYLLNARTKLGRGEIVYKRTMYLNNEEGVRAGVRVPYPEHLPKEIQDPTVAKLFTSVDKAYKEN